MTAPENPFECLPNQVRRGVPFGRQEIVREIFNSLGSDSVQGASSYSLVGPKYIGKTVILQSIVNPSVQRQYLDDTVKFHTIYLDCADLPPLPWEVFRILGKRAVETARMQWGIEFEGTSVSQYASFLETGSDATTTMAFRTLRETTWQSFQTTIVEIEDAFKGILNYLSSRCDEYLVFVLDNFEKLLSLLNESNIQLMRDAFSNTRHGLVVATPRPIRELSPKTFASKIYEIFGRKRNLQAFTIDQADDFLTDMPQDFEQQFSRSEKEMILIKAGNHPHFLRVYAAAVWRRKLQLPVGQSVEDFSRIDRKVRSKLGEDFLSLWSVLGRDLQTVLYKFAVDQVLQEDIIHALRRLETEYAVVYLKSDGRFEFMGELFHEFIISQAEVVHHLLKTDFYRAGLGALKRLSKDNYSGTDPEYYYQKAFQQFTSHNPDYDSTNAMIHNTLDRLLDMMTRRAEPYLGHVFAGSGYRDRLNFIEEAFEVEGSISNLLLVFGDMADTDGPQAGRQANLYNTQLRFYILSGVIQYLVNVRRKLNFVLGEQDLTSLYHIEESVGVTKHSRVVRATDKFLGRQVAIKSLRSDMKLTDDHTSEHLLREAQILAKLHHPNIAEIYHIIPNPLRVVMQWIDGTPLDLLDTDEPIVVREVIKIGIALADALKHAHSKGVLHRDIKPNNIILNKKREPVLIDFDIARSGEHMTITKAEDGSPIYRGTPPYSAPEQFLDREAVGFPTDLFSLGIVLYELLTGKRPYEYGNHPSPYGGDFPQPEQLNIPDSLYPILCRLLSQDPAERRDARILQEELQYCLDTL